MDSKKITVEKMGEEPREPKIVGGSKHSTSTISKKPFPKGILKKTIKDLKLKGVRDPAKSSLKKHTIRLLTSKGSKKKFRKTMKNIKAMNDKEIIEKNKQEGLIKNDKMPIHLQREVLKHAIHAGFVSE